MTDSTMQVESNSANDKTTRRLRVWPAVLIVTAMGLARAWANIGENAPSKFFFGLIIAPALALILLQVWWLFFSRLRWADRLSGFLVFVVTVATTVLVAGKNFPALGLLLFAAPVVALLWVGWLVLTYRLTWSIRRAGVLAIFVSCGVVYSSLRIDGMDGSFKSTMNWRWTLTPEDKLLSHRNRTETMTQTITQATIEAPAAKLELQDGDWPCFRGPQRDSRLSGVRIRTDWSTTPPKEIWRHPIGPGWSSISVVGERLFTQQQLGANEFVVCYNATTGEEVWAHQDTTRFEEVVAGAGPRSTPTFHEGRIYALGANGKLNCLDAATGKLYWTTDILKDSQSEKPPQWGFASSPLVSHGAVSVLAGGEKCKKSVLAYKLDSSELAWTAGEIADTEKPPHSYSSPHAATIDGVQQVLFSTNVGLTSYAPGEGKLLWEYRWPFEQARCTQPTLLNDHELLLGTGMMGGTRRLGIKHSGEEWQVEELWTTKDIKPYFNDMVVLGDHLYGFDNNIFMCVNLAQGKLKWRARGYGNGQVLLLVDQALLLILTEQGDVALVRAQPDKHEELTRFKAIEGKTWNHPSIAHGKLFVRNAEEIACFALELEPDSDPSKNDDAVGISVDTPLP